MSDETVDETVLTRVAFIGAAVGNALAIWNPMQLLRHAVGEAVRPMDVAGLILLIAFATLVVVVPPAFMLTRSQTHRHLGVAAMLLALPPLPMSLILMNLIASARQLTFKP